MPRPRFVVRPADASDVTNAVRPVQWDVIDRTRDVAVSNHDSRAQARSAARALNAEGMPARREGA